ncbi:MAG: hypothetical protein ACP5MB_07940, partial [bacterium]
PSLRVGTPSLITQTSLFRKRIFRVKKPEEPYFKNLTLWVQTHTGGLYTQQRNMDKACNPLIVIIKQYVIFVFNVGTIFAYQFY